MPAELARWFICTNGMQSPGKVRVAREQLVEQTEFLFGMFAFQHDKLLPENQVLQKQILSAAKRGEWLSPNHTQNRSNMLAVL